MSAASSSSHAANASRVGTFAMSKGLVTLFSPLMVDVRTVFSLAR
jgi:hypothetical protein